MSKPIDVVNFRKRIKQGLVESFGNECALCHQQYPNSVYDFHHLNPEEKEFGLSSGSMTHSKDAYAREAKKCIMLCANCHRLVENENYIVPLEKSNFNEEVYYQTLAELAAKNHSIIEERKKIDCPKPARDILKQDVRNMPMLQVGKKYNRSDNAIRKWLKSYGLPSRMTDIKSYSDEEWEKL